MSTKLFAEAPRRAASAMLRTLGGTEIALRVSTPMTPLDARGLGLQQYETSEVRLSPAVVRQTKAAPDALWEVLLPASDVESRLGPTDEAIADALKPGAVMLWKQRLLRIVSVCTEHFAGHEYLYRITLGE